MNPNFTLASPNFTAALNAFGISVTQEFRNMVAQNHLMLNHLMKKMNKGPGSPEKSGESIFVTYPLSIDKVPAITQHNIGVPYEQMVPAAWPSYVRAGKLTRAKYPFAYFSVPTAFDPLQVQVLSKPNNGNILNVAQASIRQAIKNSIGEQFNGNLNASSTRIMGMRYLLSQSNSPGDISQADNDWWRPINESLSGTITLETVLRAKNKLRDKVDSEGKPVYPDYCFLGTDTQDLFSELETAFTAMHRITAEKASSKFGYEGNLWYGGIEIMPDLKAPVGTLHMGCSNVLDWWGDDVGLKMSAPSRVPGSDSIDINFSGWHCFSCGNPSCFYLATGLTA